MSKGIGLISITMIVLSILAAAITQDIMVGVSILAIGLVLDVVSLISLIPIVGLIIQWFVANWVFAKLLTMLVIPANVMWIANAMFWLSIVGGIVATILVIAWIIMGISKLR